MLKPLKPAIRFKEFTNDWEQSRVGELFNISRGCVLGKKEIKSFKFGDFIYPVYSSQTENHGLLGYNNKYLDKDAITWTTDGANAGTVFYRKGYFYATNVCGILSEKLMKPNLFYSNSIGKITHKFVNKTNNPKLMSNVMSQIIVNYPNVNEQSKISDILESIFTSITLHQRKLEKLKNIKNMLLEKMFADEKTLKPAIRFKEFTNAWEQRRLGDEVLNCKSDIEIDEIYPDGKFDLYGVNGFIGKTNKIIIKDKWLIGIVKDGSVGKVFLLPPNSSFSSTIEGLFGKNDKLTKFIFWIIKRMDLSKYFIGSTIKHLYFKQYKQSTILIPAIHEQNKIVSSFSLIESLITLHRRKHYYWFFSFLYIKKYLFIWV